MILTIGNTMTDESLIDFLCGGQLDPNFEFKMKKKEIENNDFRIRKDSFSDINGAYRDFAKFRQTPQYSNAMKAKSLLSENWDTDSDALRDTLMSTYKMSVEDCNDCFRNLANSKDVDVHENVFNHTIRFRKR